MFFDYSKILKLGDQLVLRGSENTDGSSLEVAKLSDDDPEKKVVTDGDADVFKYIFASA